MEVNLLLGTGGARGLSFIGALSVLEREGISVRRIAGVSMGAIVGAAYAGGKSIGEIGDVLCKIRKREFLKPSLSGPALLSNIGLKLLAGRLLSVARFEELRIPLTVVCTDLLSGRKVCIDDGELMSPVVGSSVAGGLFDPIYYRGLALVDGGYSCPVPFCCELPGVINLALDATRDPNWEFSGGRLQNPIGTRPGSLSAQMIKTFDVLLFNLFQAQRQRGASIIVRPGMDQISFDDFARGREAIAAGENAMAAMLPVIRAAYTDLTKDVNPTVP